MDPFSRDPSQHPIFPVVFCPLFTLVGQGGAVTDAVTWEISYLFLSAFLATAFFAYKYWRLVSLRPVHNSYPPWRPTRHSTPSTMINPRLTFFSILPFVVGSMAKGRGGGGSGGGSIDDNWGAPGVVKADMAFRIIWFIVSLCLFGAMLRRLRLVPSGRYTRAPYILLSIVTGTTSIGYLLSAILLRGASGMSSSLMHNLDAVTSVLWNINSAFQPAVCLWLVHLRGRLTGATQAKSAKPWVSHFWKRIVDWSLVAITFILGISTMAIVANGWTLYDGRQISDGQLFEIIAVSRQLNYAVFTFGLLLSVDIMVSLIALRMSQKRVSFTDPLTTRLLVAVLPFVILGFIQSLAALIYQETTLKYAIDVNVYYVYNLVITIIGGVLTMGIIWGLLSTMTMPNVLWVAGAAPSSLALPVGENAGYMPQQSQQSFPPQPPVAQWQSSPYAPPTPGQYPYPVGQYQPPQNPPHAQQTYNP